MIERILHSRAFIAYTLACGTGITLDRYYCPWPSGDLMLRLIAVREPVVYAGLYYTYTLLLFTTPYILYSILFSGFYVLGWKPTKRPGSASSRPTPTRASATNFRWCWERSTIPASPPHRRTLTGSRFRSAASTPASVFSARSERARRPAACPLHRAAPRL